MESTEAAVILVTLACYIVAGFLWWYQRTPIYLCTLLSGHVSALAAPLWSYLYMIVYRPDLEVLITVLNIPLLRLPVIASAWWYTVPAMLVFWLYSTHWWFPNYLSVILTCIIFGLYHLMLETVAMQVGLWNYTAPALPFDISHVQFAAIKGTLLSLNILYVLMVVQRFAWISMFLTLLPATLLLSLIIYGILGAPFWMARLLTTQEWATMLGMLTTLGLFLWAGHIIAQGLGRTVNIRSL